MQMIHHKPADQIAERNHKLRRPACADHRPDDLIIISFLIGDIRSAGQQFLDHIRKIFRQRFSHLGSGVF